MYTVTFIKPWGPRSWLVNHTTPFYDNKRPPHVEVIDDDVTSGEVHELTNFRRFNGALMWDVIGRTNRGHQAHFTVAYYKDIYEAERVFQEQLALLN